MEGSFFSDKWNRLAIMRTFLVMFTVVILLLSNYLHIQFSFSWYSSSIPIVPGQPVSHLNANAVNATSITVTWNPPAQANGIIAYRVYNSYGNNTSQTVACDTNQTLCHISNLQGYHSYRISVIVYNVKYQFTNPTQVITSIRTPSAGEFYKKYI